MSKSDVHATAPAYVRHRRDRAAILRRSERVRSKVVVRRAATVLRSCPHCGMGLSARYRVARAQHIRRNTLPRIVCAWQP